MKWGHVLAVHIHISRGGGGGGCSQWSLSNHQAYFVFVSSNSWSHCESLLHRTLFWLKNMPCEYWLCNLNRRKAKHGLSFRDIFKKCQINQYNDFSAIIDIKNTLPNSRIMKADIYYLVVCLNRKAKYTKCSIQGQKQITCMAVLAHFLFCVSKHYGYMSW